MMAQQKTLSNWVRYESERQKKIDHDLNNRSYSIF